jgi:oxygen-independent coproporphyrinogen III oxidase
MSALVLAERKVPRYTSYPTAPHFSAAVGPESYAHWLGAVPPTATLSLYLHVPYCRELCHYCGCHTKMVRRTEPLQAYADLLAGEIALIARQIGSRRVGHIHWGGGTPSMLGAARLVELAARLRDTFDCCDVGEHAIELDPRSMDASLAAALGRMGIDRVSLGVQDFTPRVQDAIGRIQPFETVRRAVHLLRGIGIAIINLDLMYGLPHQTVTDVRRTALLAHALEPSRLALFGYAHVPWLKSHQRLIDAAALPGAQERLEQADAARATLVDLGYEAIGLDHFAVPHDGLAVAARNGRLRRNFQGYTTDAADALIGFGASAIGRLPQGFVQNAAAVGAYAAALRSGKHATARGIVLSEEDRVRGRIIERILCDFQIDLGMIDGATTESADRFAPEIEALAPLEREGLVEREGNRIRVMPKGRPFVRLVAAAFDSYLAAGKARHSAAV